jgi:hypothetical protein
VSGVVTASVWARNVARRQHPEDELQASICDYLGLALPADAVCFAIPNGGKRHAREAARMKRLGVVAGVPDLCIVHRGRALFLELKAARGVVSAAQREMIRKLIYCGAAVCVVRSVAEAEAALREACVPLRGRVA